jgi:hypothetical protein
LITEGVAILQTALARDRLGEYQAQAAIAALHADARTVDETDWVQIVEWYDELVRLTDNPVVRVNRAVAVGEADGPQAGLTALAEVDRSIARYAAVEAYLRERAGSSRSRLGFTPTQPALPPIGPSAITSPDRPHACTPRCAVDARDVENPLPASSPVSTGPLRSHASEREHSWSGTRSRTNWPAVAHRSCSRPPRWLAWPISGRTQHRE